MRLTAAAVMLLVLSISTAYAYEPQVTVLGNGLTVITQELHYAPVVASVISYRVGSRNEYGDILGMSHFCEHLMFKGTPDMPKSRFWQIVQRDGGMANAFTSNDCTCYFLLLPSSRLDDALLIESDRMVNCAIDSAEVVSERNVVHEERRMSCIDSPDGALWEALGEIAFTEHPYHNPVIGYDENILGYDWEKARRYYETYYCPSNAVLTYVGDFQTDELLLKVEDYFGDIPPGIVPDEEIPREPEQLEARLVEIEHSSNLPRFVMAFHSPSGHDPDNPAMSIISSYLSSGRSGRLEQLLVQSGLVHWAGAWNDGGIDPGLFYIFVTMNPPEESQVTMEEVQAMIWAELDELTERGIPADRLEELKNRYLAGEILDEASPLGLAMSYSLSATMFGDPMHDSNQLELIAGLSPGDVAAAASSVFRRDGVNLAVLNPSGEMGMQIGGEREALPTDITEPTSINYQGLEIPDDFLVPPENSIYEDAIEHRLDNGLVLLLKEDHTFPVVSISFAVPIGGLRHPAVLNGLADVVTETMLRGTEDLDYTEFHRRLEMEGSYLRFGSGPEYSSGSVTVLSEDIATAFQTISDLLLRPAFRETDFQTVMDEQRANLEAAAETAFSVAYDSLAAITAGTPEDYRNPSRTTLDRITLDEVLAFYDGGCRPEGSVIAVVGDIDPEAVMQMAVEYFGRWENPGTPLQEAYIPVFSTEPGDTVVTFMPGRVQATVLVARNAPGSEMPDYPAFVTMNTILGRGIGSRLGHSVRDEQGLAYGVGSWSTSYDSTGVFSAYLSTLADYVPQATSSVIAELERIASENVEDIELRLAKANAVGRYAFSGMSYSGQAGGLVNLYMNERPLDYDIRYLERVLDLQPDDIRQAASDYLLSDQWFVSIAGGIDRDRLTSE
ncbi:MAG: insulinase family protein [Candidatus Fermentibacteraceae bacterium]|nr:insulinase family protein [Candidatus Fermentibacteraceae bacterium]